MILNIRGNLIEFNRPAVMGIVNVTPDSFFAGSRVPADSVTARVSEMMAQGADIINDIGGGDLDPEMFGTIADLRVPYILMHMRGTPATMQSLTDYDDVVADVLRDLAFKTDRLHQLGVNDVIIDPGFGFAKTVDQNYRLLAALGMFREIGCPVLAGVSRKTMIWKELGIHPDEALNGTTAINMIALMNGADILRVHDVRECAETVRLFCAYQRNIPEDTHIISVSKSPHNLQ